MTVRLVQERHVAGIRQLLQDFHEEEVSEGDVRWMMRGSDWAVLVDEEQGDVVACCMIHIDLNGRTLTVDGLYPRGMSRSRLLPLLGEGLSRAVALAPVSDWTIRARFHNAVDEKGILDGGHSACLAWQEIFTRAEVVQTDPGKRRHPGQWEIRAPLRVALEDAQSWLSR